MTMQEIEKASREYHQKARRWFGFKVTSPVRLRKDIAYPISSKGKRHK